MHDRVVPHVDSHVTVARAEWQSAGANDHAWLQLAPVGAEAIRVVPFVRCRVAVVGLACVEEDVAYSKAALVQTCGGC